VPSITHSRDRKGYQDVLLEMIAEGWSQCLHSAHQSATHIEMNENTRTHTHTTENSLSPERQESATVHAASVLPDHLSGTIYHDTSETMTFVVNNSLAIWRHFCLLRPIRQRRLWERLFKRRFINGLAYLYTLTQPFYGLFSGAARVSRCQKRTSGLYGATEG